MGKRRGTMRAIQAGSTEMNNGIFLSWGCAPPKTNPVRLLNACHANALALPRLEVPGASSPMRSYVCSVTPIFLTAIGDGLASPHLHFDIRSIGDDLLGGFFLSAWHGMPSLGFETDRISLGKRCR